MKFTIQDLTPFLLVINLLFWLPLTAKAYDSVYGHQELIRLTVKAWNAGHSQQISLLESRQLEEGATAEDSPEWRSLNHFFDPDAGGLMLGSVWPVGQSAVQWAQERQSLVFARDTSWQQAKRAYRAGQRREAFFALGSLLHLLADAGVPAHVRNDDHLLGDGYERWVKERLSAGDSRLQTLTAAPAARCGDYEACLRTMALFTNRHCFSDDTINNRLFAEPYASLRAAPDGYAYANGLAVAVADADNGWRLDERVWLGYWQLLAPRVIASGQSVLERFFEEVGEPQTSQRHKGKIAGGIKISPEVSVWQPPVIDAALGVPAAFLAPPADNARMQAPVLSGGQGEPLPVAPVPAPQAPAAATATAPVIVTSSVDEAEPPLPSAGEPATTTSTGTEVAATTTASTTASSTPTSTTASSTPTSTPTTTVARFSGLSDGLLGLWHFNDGQGQMAEAAVGRPASFFAAWVPGRWGYGFRQGPENERLIVGSRLVAPVSSDYFTAVLWFRDDGQCPYCYARNRLHLDVKGYPVNLHYGLAPTVKGVDFFDGAGRDTFLAAVPDDQAWHQVALVYQPQSLSLYIDGSLREVRQPYYPLPGEISSFVFVGENGPSEFDELALWSRALSAAEISDWYQSGLELAP